MTREGSWVAREAPTGRFTSSGHRVKFMRRNGDAITPCGRVMKPSIWKPKVGDLRLATLSPNEVTEWRHKLLLCKYCDGKK